jgi:uncharacterized protein YcfL
MAMKHAPLTLLSFVTLVTFISGCSTVSQPEAGLNTDPNQQIIQTSAVDTSYPGLTRVLASEYLVGYVSLVNPRLGQTGNFTKAQVTVQNLTQNRYSVEYQYQWEDQDGLAVGSPKPWRRFVLGPKEAKILAEMALRQEAKQAMVTVRIVDDPFIELNKQVKY